MCDFIEVVLIPFAFVQLVDFTSYYFYSQIDPVQDYIVGNLLVST